jgi:hypothetical protein
MTMNKRAVAVAVIAFFCLIAVATAHSKPPPRHAFPVTHVTRNQAALMFRGCFHVAPKQWICPDPTP